MFRLEIIARIGNDAEVKQIKGNDYHSFSVAYSEKRNGQDKTTWVKCLKKVGDNDKLGQWLKKGTQVYLSGTPYTSGFVKQDNTVATDLNLFVNQLQLLGGNQQSNAPAQQAPQQDGDSDLPF